MRARAPAAVCAALCGFAVGLAGPAAAAPPTAGSQAAPPAPGDVVRTEPATSPIVSPPSAVPTDGAPVIGWAALGLAGLATVLGGAALAVALRARREDGGDEAAGPRTAERLTRLETAVRELTSHARRTPSPPPSPETRAPFPPPPGTAREPAPAPDRAGFPPSGSPAPRGADPSPDGGSSSRREAAVAPSAPRRSPDDLAAWSAELTEAFARLARDPSGAAGGFIARHRPRGVAAGPDGIGFVDAFEGAKLWAVRAPGEGEVWALTPGEQAAVNWSAHFAPQRREVAAEVFGAAFDLVEGGGEALRMEAPALVRLDASGRLAVRRRGRLAGFRG